jgi:dihydrofolate reductase
VRLSFFTFVTEGVEAAVRAALKAAGDKDVFAMGGADVIRQLLVLGLVDQLQLHLSPVLLGGGTRLFDGGDLTPFEQVDVRVSPHATHLTYVPV